MVSVLNQCDSIEDRGCVQFDVIQSDCTYCVQGFELVFFVA